MKSIILLLIPLNLALLTNGLNLARRDAPAVVEAPIRRPGKTEQTLYQDSIRRDVLSRRQNGEPVSVSLQNTIQSYIMDISIGTPPQQVGLHLDTGSSDLWVNVPTSQLCSKYARLCDELGTYNPRESSTVSVLNNGFNITYQDGSGATGDYLQDDISFVGVSVSHFEFGVGLESSTPEAVLGIGYNLNEGGAATGLAPLYQNLPARLASSGIINTNAYSLFLNDLVASTGTILFGGVNAAKYHGKLHTLPIDQTFGRFSQLIITMTAFGIDTPGSLTTNARIPALLDSGTSLTYLPPDIAAAIFHKYNLNFNSRAGAAIIPCSAASRTDTLLFTFSGVTIAVPFSELVVDIVRSSNPAVESSVCAFGIAPAFGEAGISVLGDTFLRSAYVVYDLQNNEISLAQTRFDSTLPDDILEITANGVPDAADVRKSKTNVHGIAGSGDLSGSSGNAALPVASTLGFWSTVCAVFGVVLVAGWVV